MEKREQFGDFLEKAFADCQGDSAFRMDRERPYNGQAHTDCGERGRTEVKGLTMRDISDCIVKGLLDCAGDQGENPIHDDIYKIELKEIDPGAMIQCSLCWIEKYMGIFPNVPKLNAEESNGENDREGPGTV